MVEEKYRTVVSRIVVMLALMVALVTMVILVMVLTMAAMVMMPLVRTPTFASRCLYWEVATTVLATQWKQRR